MNFRQKVILKEPWRLKDLPASLPKCNVFSLNHSRSMSWADPSGRFTPLPMNFRQKVILKEPKRLKDLPVAITSGDCSGPGHGGVTQRRW